jgi:hypothetical protein
MGGRFWASAGVVTADVIANTKARTNILVIIASFYEGGRRNDTRSAPCKETQRLRKIAPRRWAERPTGGVTLAYAGHEKESHDTLAAFQAQCPRTALPRTLPACPQTAGIGASSPLDEATQPLRRIGPRHSRIRLSSHAGSELHHHRAWTVDDVGPVVSVGTVLRLGGAEVEETMEAHASLGEGLGWACLVGGAGVSHPRFKVSGHDGPTTRLRPQSRRR